VEGHEMEPAETPVVFVHGLWLHATSWGPWVEFFQEAGYAPVAPGWPGDADTVEETRSHPEQGLRAGRTRLAGRRRHRRGDAEPPGAGGREGH